MEQLSIGDAERSAYGSDSHVRKLSGLLGTTELALNQYKIAPGDGLPAGLHAHMDQEEVFLILEGTLTFQMKDREIQVSSNSAVRFAPGEFQSGQNHGKRVAVVLAIGAPRGTEDIRIPVDCPECNGETLRLDLDRTEPRFNCPDCGAEHIPADCPECGGRNLDVTLDEQQQIVTVCNHCRTTFESPPLED